MKRFIVFLLTCMGLSSCVRTEAQQGYRKISAAEAHKMMSELKDHVLLDVRTNEEFKDTHIPGAILIPLDEIESRAEKELPDKGKAIFVYCRSGRRSANAARHLAGRGYENVYDIGGIIDWPYETSQ